MLYEVITIDLLKAYYTEKEESGYTSDLTDIDLGVAQFVLARVKLILGEWDEVISLSDAILTNYSDFITEEYYGGANKGFEIRPEENAFLYNDRITSYNVCYTKLLRLSYKICKK